MSTNDSAGTCARWAAGRILRSLASTSGAVHGLRQTARLVQLCYVDESGKAETLLRTDVEQQPVLVIAGVSFPEAKLTDITHKWLELKRSYRPELARRGRKGWLDAILAEMKGTTVRRGFRANATHRQRKNAVGVIDGTLRLLERHDARIIGRVWVKALDAPNIDMKLHASSLQFICAAFHAGLPEDERGMVVVDSQTYQHNHQLAHSMFTQRFGLNPSHKHLVDMPVFGHSDNHAGLQIADLLCSAVLAPIACAVYAGSYDSWNMHCHSGFLDIRERFGDRLHALTYDWHNSKAGKETSSLIVDDPVGRRPTRLMWEVSRDNQQKRSRSAHPRKKRSRSRAET